jgi:hypothetical protein
MRLKVTCNISGITVVARLTDACAIWGLDFQIEPTWTQVDLGDTVYVLWQTSSFGTQRKFRIVKDEDGIFSTYTLICHTNNCRMHCDCAGFVNYGKCKHIDIFLIVDNVRTVKGYKQLTT